MRFGGSWKTIRASGAMTNNDQVLLHSLNCLDDLLPDLRTTLERAIEPSVMFH
jgi:hypothetical protein